MGEGKAKGALAILLVVILLGSFHPVVFGDFVQWDDDENFLSNGSYRALGWSGLRWAFTTHLLGVYQPLAWVAFELEYAAFGLRPWGYHLTSMVLYATAAVVLYDLVIRLVALAVDGPVDRARLHLAAFMATAIVSAHPLRAEIVAWASCQPYILCAIFYLLAMRYYLAGATRPEGRACPYYVASYSCVVAALLAKAAAVSLPVVLGVLHFYPVRRRMAHGKQRRWSVAFHLASLLSSVPFLVLARRNLGEVLLATGRTGAAVLCFSEAARLEPASPALRNKLGLSLRARGEAAAARCCFRAACELQEEKLKRPGAVTGDFTDLAGYLNNLGQASADLGLHGEALDAYESAIRLERTALSAEPGSIRARRYLGNHYLNLARLYRKLGQHELAVRMVLRRRQLWEGEPEELYLAACELARCATSAGQAPTAQAVTQRRVRAYEDLVLDSLRRAVRAGLTDPQRILREPDLRTQPATARIREVIERPAEGGRAGF